MGKFKSDSSKNVDSNSAVENESHASTSSEPEKASEASINDSDMGLEQVQIKPIEGNVSSLDITADSQNPYQPQEEEKPKRQRLALFFKRYSLNRPFPNVALSIAKTYDAMSIVMEEDVIEELISLNAPIGIFERVD